MFTEAPVPNQSSRSRSFFSVARVDTIAVAMAAPAARAAKITIKVLGHFAE